MRKLCFILVMMLAGQASAQMDGGPINADKFCNGVVPRIVLQIMDARARGIPFEDVRSRVDVSVPPDLPERYAIGAQATAAVMTEMVYTSILTEADAGSDYMRNLVTDSAKRSCMRSEYRRR